MPLAQNAAGNVLFVETVVCATAQIVSFTSTQIDAGKEIMSSYDKAEKAITDYFCDTTNTHEATKQGLIGLRDHIVLPALTTPKPSEVDTLTDSDIDEMAMRFSGTGGVEDYRAFARTIELRVRGEK